MEENKTNFELSTDVSNESKDVATIEKNPQNIERIRALVSRVDLHPCNQLLSITY